VYSVSYETALEAPVVTKCSINLYCNGATCSQVLTHSSAWFSCCDHFLLHCVSKKHAGCSL